MLWINVWEFFWHSQPADGNVKAYPSNGGLLGIVCFDGWCKIRLRCHRLSTCCTDFPEERAFESAAPHWGPRLWRDPTEIGEADRRNTKTHELRKRTNLIPRCFKETLGVLHNVRRVGKHHVPLVVC